MARSGMEALPGARLGAIALVAVAWLAASDAHAETALELSNVCRIAESVAQKPHADSVDEGAKALKCWAYVLGAEEMLISIFAASPKTQPVCFPEGVTRRERVGHFVKFVEDDTAMWTLPAAAVYLVAMAKRYPCRK